MDYNTKPLDLKGKMEALVHDLSIALEESSNSALARRRWGIRRRARSTGNIPLLVGHKQSEERSDSSSICDSNNPKNINVMAPPKYQSDSDDTNLYLSKQFAPFSKFNIYSNIESDSVNENFVPRVTTRRKRKFKRMAIDSDSNPSTSQVFTKRFSQAFTLNNTLGKKKRIFRNDCDSRYKGIWCGKRKRSCRERSTDCEMRSAKPGRSARLKNKNKTQNEDAMDCSHLSSSSISSSDSEDGLITNDEDREGDDEQSDWIGEPSTWWEECDSTNKDKSCPSTIFQATMYGNYDNLNEETKKNCRRLQWFRDGVSGREILAGRRHVENTPGYSIKTSANEQVSRFLQDQNQRELKLNPIRQFELAKLRCLANLYNLNLKFDLNCPILCKTKRTMQAVCVDQVSLLHRLSDNKRLRKTPPNSPNPPELEMESSDLPSASRDMKSPLQSIEAIQTVVPQNLVSNIPLYNWNGIKMAANEAPPKPKIHSFGHSKSS